MAISNLDRDGIRDEILRLLGYDSSTLAPWESDANLYSSINMVAQRIPLRVAEVLREKTGKPVGKVGLDMWRTVGSLTETSGSSTVHFPVDYDHYITFYDRTAGRKLDVVENVKKYWVKQFQWRPDANRQGPPEAIEILGFVNNSGTWQRQGTLWPNTVTGVTPDIELTYYRLPDTLASSTDVPDSDPKFEYLWVLETVLHWMRPDEPSYSRFQEEERAMIMELAATAKAIG